MGQCRHQGNRADTAEFLSGEQHACITGMGGKGEHPPSHGRDNAIVIQSAKIVKEGFRPEQCRSLWSIKPPDGFHGGKAGRLQCQ